MHCQCKTGADVLEWAEKELGIVSAMQDRATCGNHPPPVMPNDYLAWWEDEAIIQQDNADTENDTADAAQTRDYAEKIGEFCADLRELGISPSRLPWAEKAGAL